MKKLLALAAALLAACGGSEKMAADFAAATPDAAGLTLETSGSAADGALATTPQGDLALAAQAAIAPCQPWEYLCNIQAGIRGLNTYVKALVGPVEAMAKLPPSSPAPDVRVFGPLDVAGVGTFRLTVVEVSDGFFRWKLEAKKIGDPDSAYQVVMAGEVTRSPGDLDHRGRGIVGIDLDALASALNPPAPAAPIFKGAGKILAGFAHVGQAKALAYLLKGFVADVNGSEPPIDLALVGHKLASGITRVRLAGLKDFIPVTSARELILSRAGWFPGLGGRAAVAVGLGDIPAGTFYVGVSCFDVSEMEVYRDLFVCTALGCLPVPEAQLPDPQFRVGTPSLCVLGTEIEDPSAPTAPDQTSVSPEPNAPATPPPPPNTMADVNF